VRRTYKAVKRLKIKPKKPSGDWNRPFVNNRSGGNNKFASPLLWLAVLRNRKKPLVIWKPG